MTNIYVITNKINGKQYVGQTIKPIKYRFLQHYHNSTNCYIDNAMKKDGVENFSLSLLCTCPDEDANVIEAYYIDKLKTHYSCGGYNITRGGDFNPMSDKVSREHWDLAIHTAGYIEKQRKSATGRKHTVQSKEKMSIVQKQYYIDHPELKKQIALNQPTRMPVNMLDENENVICKFDTLSDACRYFDKDTRNTSSLKKFVDKYNHNGKRAKFWGYCWTVQK